MDHFNKIGFLFFLWNDTFYLSFEFASWYFLQGKLRVKRKRMIDETQIYIHKILFNPFAGSAIQSKINRRASLSLFLSLSHTHTLSLSLSRSLLLPFGQIKWSKYKTALHRKLFCCISKDYFSFAHSSPYSSNVKYSLDVLIIPRAWVFGSSLFRSISALVKIVQLAALIDQTLS